MLIVKEHICYSIQLKAFVKVVETENAEYYCQTAPCGFSKIKKITFDRLKENAEKLYDTKYRDDL